MYFILGSLVGEAVVVKLAGVTLPSLDFYLNKTSVHNHIFICCNLAFWELAINAESLVALMYLMNGRYIFLFCTGKVPQVYMWSNANMLSVYCDTRYLCHECS